MKEINFRPVAVDVAVMTIDGDGLSVLLTKVDTGVFAGRWAIPGRLIANNESLDEAVEDVVKNGVGRGKTCVRQLFCAGSLERDVEKKSVAVVYCVLIEKKEELVIKDGGVYGEIKWFDLDALPEMAFDHRQTLVTIKKKMAYMLDEDEVVSTLLPEIFTLSDLRRVYEILLEKKIDKRNFVKKIMAEDRIEDTGEVRAGEAYRPARLFRFKV